MAVLQYEGTRYFGWQVQPGRQTVQGEIMRALEKLFKAPVQVKYTSRTDRGVHARGQVITFRPPFSISCEAAEKALNGILNDDIIVTRVKRCADDFDPRYSVHSKMYAYRIYTGKVPHYMTAKFSWHFPYEIDWGLVKKGASMLKGEHEFKHFSSAAEGRQTRINIISSTLSATGEMYEIKIRAPFFRMYMVRHLVGFLVAVGRGKRQLEDLGVMLDGEGGRCTFCAPAKGLELRKIYFGAAGRKVFAGAV